MEFFLSMKVINGPSLPWVSYFCASFFYPDPKTKKRIPTLSMPHRLTEHIKTKFLGVYTSPFLFHDKLTVTDITMIEGVVVFHISQHDNFWWGQKIQEMREYVEKYFSKKVHFHFSKDIYLGTICMNRVLNEDCGTDYIYGNF
jgi:hypothetical protein